MPRNAGNPPSNVGVASAARRQQDMQTRRQQGVATGAARAASTPPTPVGRAGDEARAERLNALRGSFRQKTAEQPGRVGTGVNSVHNSTRERSQASLQARNQRLSGG